MLAKAIYKKIGYRELLKPIEERPTTEKFGALGWNHFCNRISHSRMKLFVCFDLGLQISNPVIEYQSDPSCMSYMEARAEMP